MSNTLHSEPAFRILAMFQAEEEKRILKESLVMESVNVNKEQEKSPVKKRRL